MMHHARLFATLLLGVSLSPTIGAGQTIPELSWQPDFIDWVPDFDAAEQSALRLYGSRLIESTVENIEGEQMRLWLNYFIRPTQKAGTFYVELFSTSAFETVQVRFNQPPFRIISANFPGMMVQINTDTRIEGRSKVFADFARSEVVSPVLRAVFGTGQPRIKPEITTEKPDEAPAEAESINCANLDSFVGGLPYEVTIAAGLSISAQSVWPLVSVPGLDEDIHYNPTAIIGLPEITSISSIRSDDSEALEIALGDFAIEALEDALALPQQGALEFMADGSVKPNTQSLLVLSVNGRAITALPIGATFPPGPLVFSGGALTDMAATCLAKASTGG